MKTDRRNLLKTGTAALAVTLLSHRAALALTESEATSHVRGSVDAVLALVRAPGDAASKATALRKVLEARAAMPQIARFAAGIAWRDMTPAQQERFVTAFSHFLSTVYARRFTEYSGETVEIGEVIDAGKRGLVVRSRVSQPQGAPVIVDWLVTDRPGRVVIADIVIEGISLLVTQREEVGNMLETRKGNVDQLITDLAAA